MISLLPSLFTPSDPQVPFYTKHVTVHNVAYYLKYDKASVWDWFLSQLSMQVQFSLMHHIQAMVKPEQNRQILCEGGLVSTLLTHCKQMLLAPNHPLHVPVTRILEKLSSQAITHSDFRSELLSFWGSHTFNYCSVCKHIRLFVLKKHISTNLWQQDTISDVRLFLFLRKFLCLGDPLMCLADATAVQSQQEIPVSNGI